MELVDDKKLEAVANFITNDAIDGNCTCNFFLNTLSEEMQKELNATCRSSKYVDEWCYDCPLYSKEDFAIWLKQPYKKLDVEDLKRPKKEDFIGIDIQKGALALDNDYIKALEKYCDSLELYIKCKDESKLKNEELADKLEQIRGILDEHD